jgi:hypothetical protein
VTTISNPAHHPTEDYGPEGQEEDRTQQTEQCDPREQKGQRHLQSQGHQKDRCQEPMSDRRQTTLERGTLLGGSFRK